MKSIRRTLLGVGVIVSAGYLLYAYGLSENAQKSFRAAARTTYSAIRKLSELVTQPTGTAKDEGVASAQRRAAREQWEILGY
jgi:hypothetical protein